MIAGVLELSWRDIRELRVTDPYSVHRVSSAMTFFQGKRNETFPERFTIVS